MKIKKYISIVEKTDRLRPIKPTNSDYKVAPIMGLAGETGELLTELKKVKREYGRAGLIHKKRIEEELGDILWYAVTIARRAGLDFQRDILFDNLVGVSKNPSLYMPLVDDDKSPGKSLQEAIQQDGVRTADTFKAYQDHAFKSVESKSDREANHLYLSKIWKNVSDLLIKVDAKSANFSAQECGIVSKVVGDVMWYVAGFATLYNISLNTIAARNSKKVMSKFAPEVDRDRTPHRYDYDFPIREQFPKKFDVVFAPAPSDRRQAVMIINGIRVGDPLNDNAYEIDHYRFHDSIHLAFVAMLGWSPVMRSLMKLKRKKRRDIDDAEDGARASIVEEMIVKLAHTYATGIDRKKLLDGRKSIDFDLLKQIKLMAEGLEVAGSREKDNLQAVEYWEWEEAILAGFHIYSELRRNKRGRVRLDLDNRKIDFIKLKAGEEDIFPLLS